MRQISAALALAVALGSAVGVSQAWTAKIDMRLGAVYFDGGTEIEDRVNPRLITRDGNIAWNGSRFYNFAGPGWKSDLLVGLFSPAGEEIWRVDRANYGDASGPIIETNSGDLLVNAETPGHYWLLKFNGATGALLWRRQLTTPQQGGYGFAITPAGHIVTQIDSVLSRRSADYGPVEWSVDLAAALPADTNFYRSTGPVSDAAGNIYVGLYPPPSHRYHQFIVKVDGATGQIRWSKELRRTYVRDGVAYSEACGAGASKQNIRPSPDGNLVLVCYENDLLHLWAIDGETGTDLWDFVTSTDDRNCSLSDFPPNYAFAPGGNIFALRERPKPGAVPDDRDVGVFCDFHAVKLNSATGEVLLEAALSNGPAGLLPDEAGLLVVTFGRAPEDGTIPRPKTLTRFDNSGSEMWRKPIPEALRVASRDASSGELRFVYEEAVTNGTTYLVMSAVDDLGDDAPSLCGNGVLDPGEHCDDGNSEANDTCPSQWANQCRYNASTVALARGSRRKPSRDAKGCQLQWYVLNPGNAVDRYGLPDYLQTCTDGDPSCDFDPAPGTCGFQAVTCAATRDMRMRRCDPSGIADLTLLEPNPAKATSPEDESRRALNAGTLGNAFNHLLDPKDPSAGYSHAIPLAADKVNACSEPFEVSVPVGKQGVWVKTKSHDTRKRVHRTKLHFVCEAAS